MSQTVAMPEPREPFKLNVRWIIMMDEQFELFCRENVVAMKKGKL